MWSPAPWVRDLTLIFFKFLMKRLPAQDLSPMSPLFMHPHIFICSRPPGRLHQLESLLEEFMQTRWSGRAQGSKLPSWIAALTAVRPSGTMRWTYSRAVWHTFRDALRFITWCTIFRFTFLVLCRLLSVFSCREIFIPIIPSIDVWRD